ncbi:MAG: alpha-E domain-containing protein, partial [Saprospiraceae bacterium]|nr:alpha-E domain-containing protein [Saprospiraceae bacterium]
NILEEVAFNLDNHNSILSIVKAARENARSVRYTLSTELWEVINRYYHYVNDYSVPFYKTRGLYDFTINVTMHTSIIQSYIDRTLLYDDTWIFLKLGIHIERCTQILRILNSKIIDINVLTNNDFEDSLTTYQWTTTLKIMEAFDMCRRYYKGDINQENVISFLLSNPSLSRSLVYNLNEIDELLSQLSFAAETDAKLSFQAAKLASSFKFLEYSEIEDNLQPFLINALSKIYKLHDLIEEEYFK